MPVYAVPARPPVALKIADTAELFPVRRVYCVGQNYAEHALEMGGNPEREDPFFFSKPADAVTQDAQIPYPPATEDLQHEVELVVALGADGKIFGSAVGLDLTRRDLQRHARSSGRPWDMAKGFDCSAPLGLLRPGPPPQAGTITLSVHGKTRQKSSLAHMIWTVEEILERLSRFVKLEAGDLVFTGTPEGVAPLVCRDVVRAEIEGLPVLEIEIT